MDCVTDRCYTVSNIKGNNVNGSQLVTMDVCHVYLWSYVYTNEILISKFD